MEAVTDPSLHHHPFGPRSLQSAGFPAPHETLASQLGPNFDPNNCYPHNFYAQSQTRSQPQPRIPLQSQQVNGHHQATSHSPNSQNAQSNNSNFNAANGTRYPVLASEQHYNDQQPLNLYTPVRALHQQGNTPGGYHGGNSDQNPNAGNEEGGGHFSGMKLVENPPDLEQWRERLFNVDEIVTLTEEEFQTYFPHIDNVYSHRSTQKYKRKPFVSHYWDCRLKGRPPGTPKSSDPNKKKRRRTARERDLCDVKIKITEYFPGAAALMAQPDFSAQLDSGSGDSSGTMNYLMDPNTSNGRRHNTTDTSTPTQPFGILAPSSNLPADHPGASGARYYTVQRINGAAAGDKQSDVPGSGSTTTSAHKHSLAESDRVKKNSVQRYLLKAAKEAKKSLNAASASGGIPSPTTSTAKLSHSSIAPGTASGSASRTAKLHSQPTDLILYGNAYCPFAQRVWIALEIKQIPYQYIEVVPEHMSGGNKARPQALLDVCPSGTVPCIRHGNWGAWESGVLMEYVSLRSVLSGGVEGIANTSDILQLEDLSIGHPLLPLGDPRLRAHCRLWTDHVSPTYPFRAHCVCS
jgi:glutathione S-transferase